MRRSARRPALTRSASLALLAVAASACAGPREGVTRIARAAGTAGLVGPAFSEEEDHGTRIVSWTASGSFWETATFLEALPRQLPSGCSVRLAMTHAPRGDQPRTNSPVVLTIAGAFAPERRHAGSRPCATWPVLGGALRALSDATPQHAWLTELVQEGPRLQLAGVTAGGREGVRETVRALEGAPAFTSARILETSAGEPEGSQATRFRIELTLTD